MNTKLFFNISFLRTSLRYDLIYLSIWLVSLFTNFKATSILPTIQEINKFIRFYKGHVPPLENLSPNPSPLQFFGRSATNVPPIARSLLSLRTCDRPASKPSSVFFAYSSSSRVSSQHKRQKKRKMKENGK